MLQSDAHARLWRDTQGWVQVQLVEESGHAQPLGLVAPERALADRHELELVDVVEVRP